jgi:hypothetical protein
MDDSPHGRLRHWFNADTLAGHGQSWGDGSLVRPRMFGPLVDNKMLNEGVDYPMPLVLGSSISRG